MIFSSSIFHSRSFIDTPSDTACNTGPDTHYYADTVADTIAFFG